MIYYLSFAGDDGWLGSCIVIAETAAESVQQAWAQGCNPGGEVLMGPVPVDFHDRVRPHLNKLITDKQQLDAVFGEPLTMMTREQIAEASFIRRIS